MAASGLPILEIVEQTGKARTTVWRYLKEAGKSGMIEKTHPQVGSSCLSRLFKKENMPDKSWTSLSANTPQWKHG